MKTFVLSGYQGISGTVDEYDFKKYLLDIYFIME